MHSALEVSERQIVDSSGKSRGWLEGGWKEHRGGRSKATSTGVMAGSRVGIEDGAGRKAERSGGPSDGEIEVESSAVHGIGIKRDDGIQIAKHGEPEYCIHGDIRAESKRDGDTGSRSIDIRGVVTDYSSQIAMASSIEIGGVANGAAELDGFKRIDIIEGSKISHEIGTLGHQP